MSFESIILAIEPRAKASIVSGLSQSWDQCVSRAALTTKLRQAHFLAQTAHESAGFTTTTEFASGRAYEGRKNLGNNAKGDGVRCKGRGLIQNTGAAAYKLLSRVFGVDFYAAPEKLAEFPWAALAAAYYWSTHICRGGKRLNELADADDILGVTRGVNGGENGLASRKRYLARAKHALSDLKGALVSRAVEERASAAVKVKAASATATTAVAAPATTVASTSNSTALIITAVVVVVSVSVAIWLYSQIRKHNSTATALDAAAQGA